MKLQIKKQGTSKVLILPKPFLEYFKLKEGDWLDLSDVIKCNPSQVKQ